MRAGQAMRPFPDWQRAHLNVNEASRRYSPAQVIAVERVAVEGEPERISTSYVERVSPAGKSQNQAWLKLKSRQSGGLGRIAVLASRIALDIQAKAMLLAGELYGGWRLQ